MDTVKLSTSTQILFLQERINSLENHMNWVIGGVTITITVLMAIFAVIQFVYQKKIEQTEIEKIEKRLKAQVNNDLIEKEQQLKTFTKEIVTQAENRLSRRVSYLNADISRRFAIDCSKDGLHATAFIWWLAAAVGYAENNDERIYSISIKETKESLQRISEKQDIDLLLESTVSIMANLQELRTASHKVEADLLEDIFKEKIKTKPQEIKTIQS